MPSYREAEALDELAQAPIGRLTTIAALGFAVEDAPNNVDAATFEPDDSAELDAKIALVVVRPKAIRDAVSLGLAVRKVGVRERSHLWLGPSATHAGQLRVFLPRRAIVRCGLRADWHLSVREGREILGRLSSMAAARRSGCTWAASTIFLFVARYERC